MWLVSVTRSQVWMGSRCVKFGVVRLVPGYLAPPPPREDKRPACESSKLSLAYVTVTSRIPGPPLERTKGPAWQSTKLSLAYVTVTSRTQHTGGSTPCTDGLIISPSPHHLKFTEKSMQCNVYKKVTIHVWYLLKCLSAPGKMVSFSQS